MKKITKFLRFIGIYFVLLPLSVVAVGSVLDNYSTGYSQSVKSDTAEFLDSQTIAQWQQEVYKEINRIRKENKLLPLETDQNLEKSAQSKAKKLKELYYFGHTPNGEPFYKEIVAQGYERLYYGENLAYGFPNSKDLVQGWYKSYAHKLVLLSERARSMGLGVENFQEKPGYLTTKLFVLHTAGGYSMPVKTTKPNCECK